MIEVVAALIWKHNRFMICQRPAHKARPLLWEFPGGKVEPGESKQAALIRECREELDIALRAGSLFCEAVHAYSELTIHLSVYNASIIAGIPRLLEHNGLRWITAEDIPLYKFCPADESILKQIQKTLNTFDWDKDE